MKEKDSSRKQRVKAIIWIVMLAAAFTAAFFLLRKPIMRYAENPELLKAVVRGHPLLGRGIYLAIAFLQVVVAILPGEPVEILGGYAFGAWEGTALFLLAGAAGSMLVFWLVRRFGVKLVRVFFKEEQLDKLHFLRTKKGREFLFFLIFAMPGTPKDLLSYFAGLTDVPAGLWLIICSLGRIPSVITSTFGGSALSEGNYWKAAAVFGGTILISGAGVLIYRAILKRNEVHTKDETDAAEHAPEEEEETT